MADAKILRLPSPPKKLPVDKSDVVDQVVNDLLSCIYIDAMDPATVTRHLVRAAELAWDAGYNRGRVQTYH